MVLLIYIESSILKINCAIQKYKQLNLIIYQNKYQQIVSVDMYFIY